MKKSPKTSLLGKLLLNTALLFSIASFWGCVTTSEPEEVKPTPPKVETEISEVTQEEASTPEETVQEPQKEPEPPKPKEPEDPPDVAFAKMLQKELAAGNLKGAISLFDTIPDELAQNKDMLLLQSSLYLSDSDYENAKKIAVKLLDYDSDDLEILELNLIIAKASKNKADYKTYSAKILEIDPYNTELNIQVAQDYVLNRKYKQAKNSYKKALTNAPKNTDALFGYGQMCFFIDDIKEAKNTFLKIIDIDPNHATALAYLGKIAAENDNYLTAIKYVQSAIKCDDKVYEFHMDLGKYYQQLNRPTDAIREWEIARDLDPTYFLAYAYLAGINDERNNFNEALKNYRKVIETNPKYYYAYESAAILEWHEENWSESRKDFMKAYETSGKKDWSYALMIAATYYKENNSLKAKEWLQSVMKKMNKESIEYQMVKFYNDNYSKNGATTLIMKINKEDNSTKRGKLWFYMGLYLEIYGGIDAAADMYAKVTAMQAPMFFEYRMAEWGLGINN